MEVKNPFTINLDGPYMVFLNLFGSILLNLPSSSVQAIIREFMIMSIESQGSLRQGTLANLDITCLKNMKS